MTDSRIPEWARRLASAVPGYEFKSYLLSGDRRSVAAERVKGTTGPVIVITSDEKEMRTALGVNAVPGQVRRKPKTLRSGQDER